MTQAVEERTLSEPQLEPERPVGATRGKVVLRVLTRPTSIFGLLIISIVVSMAIFAPLLAPFDPYKTNIVFLLRPPSAEFWLGTDELGRDLLSRIIYGARYTLYAGLAAVLIGCSFGTTLGLIAAYFSNWLDNVVMTLSDVLLSFPYFLLVIVLVAVLGTSLTTAMFAIGVWTAPYYTRVVRANVMELRERPFVEAAIVSGEGRWNVVLRHILPNCLPSILVLSTTYLSQAILMAAALSFLGLGAQPPVPEWGAMTSVGREYLFQAPHMILIPSAFIFVTAIAVNFIGDNIRDSVDPRLMRR